MIYFDMAMLAFLIGLVVFQYRRRGLLLTPSAAALIVGLILMVYAAYPFAVDSESLRTIGATGYAVRTLWAVDEVIVMATVGFGSALLAYILPPMLRKRRRNAVKTAKRGRLSIEALTVGACATSFIGVAFVWLFFVIVGTIPMLTSDPDFVRSEIVANHPSRYIYTGGFTMASVGFVFLLAGLALKRITLYRPFVWVVIALVAYTNYLTATRSNLLAPFVYAGLIYFSVGPIKLTIPRALALLVVLLVAASLLQLMRMTSTSMSLAVVYYELLHGNTLFSNLRDSGWLLMNFQAHQYSFYWGKTLLAQALGFIPRSLLPLREAYGWGTVTLDILGTRSFAHFGYGHVWFFDWYLNFGYPGVVVEGIFMGLMYRRLDTSLLGFAAAAKKANTYDYFDLFKIWLAWIILGCCFTSSSILLIYPLVLGFVCLYGSALIAQKVTGTAPGLAAREEDRKLAPAGFRQA